MNKLRLTENEYVLFDSILYFLKLFSLISFATFSNGDKLVYYEIDFAISD